MQSKDSFPPILRYWEPWSADYRQLVCCQVYPHGDIGCPFPAHAAVLDSPYVTGQVVANKTAASPSPTPVDIPVQCDAEVICFLLSMVYTERSRRTWNDFADYLELGRTHECLAATIKAATFFGGRIQKQCEAFVEWILDRDAECMLVETIDTSMMALFGGDLFVTALVHTCVALLDISPSPWRTSTLKRGMLELRRQDCHADRHPAWVHAPPDALAAFRQAFEVTHTLYTLPSAPCVATLDGSVILPRAYPDGWLGIEWEAALAGDSVCLAPSGWHLRWWVEEDDDACPIGLRVTAPHEPAVWTLDGVLEIQLDHGTITTRPIVAQVRGCVQSGCRLAMVPRGPSYTPGTVVSFRFRGTAHTILEWVKDDDEESIDE